MEYIVSKKRPTEKLVVTLYDGTEKMISDGRLRKVFLKEPPLPIKITGKTIGDI
jgi:hypothetical protein